MPGGSDKASGREAILSAAAQTIARQGVRGLKVDEVAKRAGTSIALLYYHFGSRTGLVRAALERADQQAPSTRMLDPARGAGGCAAVEDALVAELDDDPAIRDNLVVWNEVSASAVFDEALRPALLDVTQSWQAAIAAAVRAAVEEGSARDDVDPDRAAELLTTLVDGASQRWLSGVISLEEARELVRNAVRETLAPRERATSTSGSSTRPAGAS